MKYGINHKNNSKEYRRRQALARRIKDPVGYLLRQAKYRARKSNLKFSVAKEDLLVPEFCPVFGLKLKINKGRRRDDSYSIDRVDNSKGYTKENTRVVSFRLNQYKGNLTIVEVERMLQYMKGQI